MWEKGFAGTSQSRVLAIVKITIGNKTFEECVTLGTMEELERKGILALDLRKDSSLELLGLVKVCPTCP